MIRMTVGHMELKPSRDVIRQLGIDPGGEVQRFYTESCLRYMMKYIPMNQGNLTKKHIINTTATEISCEDPSVLFLYKGIGMVDEETGSAWAKEGHRKVVNGVPLVYDTTHHPLAGAYWAEHMWADHESKIVQETQDYLDWRNR